MSGVLKKIGKGVKKVFKKVVKVVKKVVKSKLFKIVAIAALAYFAITLGPGILASMGSAGTAAAGGGGLSAITTAAVPNLATGIGSTMVANTAGAAASTGFAGSIAAGAKVVGSAIGSIGPTMGSAMLTTGGKMLSGYASAKAEEQAEKDRQKELDENGSFKLQMEGRGDFNAVQDIGGVSSNAGEAALDQGALSNQKESAISRVANVELNGKKQRKDYYDSSTNQYAQA